MEDQHEIDRVEAAVARGVEAGLQRLLANPDTYKSMQEGATRWAQSEAGNWTLGVLGSVFRWVFRGLMIVGFLYWVGGLPLVAAYFKSGAK